MLASLLNDMFESMRKNTRFLFDSLRYTVLLLTRSFARSLGLGLLCENGKRKKNFH